MTETRQAAFPNADAPHQDAVNFPDQPQESGNASESIETVVHGTNVVDHLNDVYRDLQILTDQLERKDVVSELCVPSICELGTASWRTYMATKSGSGSVTVTPIEPTNGWSARDKEVASDSSIKTGGSGGNDAGMKARKPAGCMM